MDVDVVIGSTGGVDGGWRKLIEKIFGTTPNEKEKQLKSSRLMLSWLTSVCKVLPDVSSDEAVRRYTQAIDCRGYVY